MIKPSSHFSPLDTANLLGVPIVVRFPALHHEFIVYPNGEPADLAVYCQNCGNELDEETNHPDYCDYCRTSGAAQ